MTTYTLKLVSGVNYNLYNGATLVSDADLATLFGSAGSAFFVFDFDGGTPTNLTSLTIVDSNSQAVITNTGLSGIAENTNFNGDWSASATAFDTFVKSPAAVLDEAQMSDLMGKIKSVQRELVLSEDNTVAYQSTQRGFNKLGYLEPGVYNVKFNFQSTPSGGVLIGTENFQHPEYLYNLSTIEVKNGSTFMVSGKKSTGANNFRIVASINSPSSPSHRYIGQFKAYSFSSSSQPGYAGTIGDFGYILTTKGINNTLTSTDNIQALSAAQGKVLADRIGNLTTLTTTTKTSAVAAINEVNGKVLTNAGAPTTSTVGVVGQLLTDTTNGRLYICTDATNPYVWEEVGGGGGIQNALIIREWS